LLSLLLQVVKERDLIGAQLVRRNDELVLLYEKIKIMQMTLDKGERQYSQRLEDIRVLKLEIRNLRCKIDTLERTNMALDDLKLGARTGFYLSLLLQFIDSSASQSC